MKELFINKLNKKYWVLFTIYLFVFINVQAEQNNTQISQYQRLTTEISKKNYFEIIYSPSKHAAIVDHDSKWTQENGITATYINFKTQQIYDIVSDVPNLYPKWLNDSTALISISCGTGCERQIIFIAPQTTTECPVSPIDKDNFTTTTPIAISTKQGLYACYDFSGHIQIYQLPHAIKTITPPGNSSVEQAIFDKDNLIITYKDNAGQKTTQNYSLDKK